ncbi:MAG: hypothetical protein CMB22_02215 [Euryarchaeota archaeon]|nr:hypothetical protein [Euryarchaeota archaeon]
MGSSPPANMYCLPSIGGTKSDRSPVISMLTGASSEGTAAANGERLARSITETIITAEEIELQCFRPISLNTPCCIQYLSVLRRILTSMEHRSYMSHAGRPRIQSRALALILIFSLLCTPVDAASEEQEIGGEVVVIRSIPHDSGAFTQGLVMDDGRLFESTGLFGESTLREIDATSGEVIRSTNLESSLFGEGIAVVGDKIFMLTWLNQTALVFDMETFNLTSVMNYEGEGWGLCFDGSSLVMSNGTSSISFRNPENFEIIRSIEVTDSGGNEVIMINELECVRTDSGDKIFANVWQEDRILMIDPSNGSVIEEFDVSFLSSQNLGDNNEVLNGIAHNGSSEYWITGKNWTSMYLVELTTSLQSADGECHLDCSPDESFETEWLSPAIVLALVLTGIAIFMKNGATGNKDTRESSNRHDEQPTATPQMQRSGGEDR